MKKNYFYIFIALLTCTVAFTACKNTAAKSKMHGKWHSADGKTHLTITEKDFVLDEGDGAIAENYFTKGDSVFTSYEGAQPYTKFQIKDLQDKSLTLVYPDSNQVKFVR